MGKQIQSNQQKPVKVYNMDGYTRMINDFSESGKQYEIKARTNGLRNKILGNMVTEVDTLHDAIKTVIENGLGQEIAQLKVDETAYEEHLAVPREETIRYYKERLSPEKVQEMAKVMEATVDKIPAIEKRRDQKKWELAGELAKLDYMEANDYKGMSPVRELYDNKPLYLAILIIFSLAEWWLTMDALRHHGGFNNTAAPLWAAVIGSVLALCAHLFGRSCYKKNKVAMVISGIVGLAFCLIIILLRTKII